MNKKKALLTVLAMVLVCVMSVMGTVAYLQANTGAVTNTFVSAIDDGEKFVDTLTLQEYKVAPNDAGLYVEDKTAEKVTSNEYGKVLPGTTLPKTPVISVTGKNDAAGYLYVEVVCDLPATFTWTVDETKWLDINVTGPHGGKVYVYTTDETTAEEVITNVTVEGILTNNQITVANVDDIASLNMVAVGYKMEFYAYLCQATVGSTSDASEVFTAVFNTPANP